MKGATRNRSGARRTRPPEPGIGAWLTHAILLELESRGIDAGQLLARTQLTRAMLEDRDGWISLRSHVGFFQGAIAASGDPAFGIAVGRRLPHQQVSRVGSLLAALSGTLGEAFESWTRYVTLMADGTLAGVTSTADHDAIWGQRLPALPPFDPDGPALAMGILDFTLHVLGGKIRPVAYRLPGPAPRVTTGIVAALGAPVEWGSERFEVRFAPGAFTTPLPQGDALLRTVLADVADRSVAMRRGDLASARVRAAILQLGFSRSRTVGTVARALGVSPRTLQHWLTQEGLTFSKIRGETVSAEAARLLGEPEASITNVSEQLGFPSRNAFHLAIRRWTGKTPVRLARNAARPRRRPR